MLDDARQRHLLAIARAAIARQLGTAPPVRAPGLDPTGEPGSPAFVTLTKGEKLCGCVGRTDPAGTLDETVAACAVAAATADPRFPPLRPDELPHVHIEVSLLSPPAPLADPSALVVGTHGIIVSRDGRRALLLPQVAAEHRWTAETFLAEACRKAGLPADAWCRGARIEVFTAEVFGEP